MVKNNTFAAKFKQDEKIYGLPLRSFSEFVYYKKSIFKELGLTIPETWEDFIATAEKIKEESDYIPIAMGGKDVWPVYPFNEFMPHLVGNDEKILTNITKEDEPFSTGSGFYEAYKMIDALYRTNVMGTDPLGMGCDQCQQLFEANKAAMILLGQWYLPNYLERVGNADDLGFFALPVVHEGETNRLMTMADNFLTINKNSENVEAAKLFIEWSFSKEIYSGYLTATLNNSTVAGIDNDNPLFKEFRDNNKADLFLYYPGDENYSKLVNQTKFDTKNIGQKMLAGESFEDILAEMNEAWKAARAELGIQ
jgi:raffinose/stachyose/melibiose transport system substrate-binding protein